MICSFLLNFYVIGTVWCPLLPIQQSIGLLVIYEHFLLVVPIQFSIKLHGDIADQTGYAGLMPYFYRGNRGFSAFYTIQPIPVLIIYFIQMGFVLSYRSEEHTSELQSREKLVCRIPLE